MVKNKKKKNRSSSSTRGFLKREATKATVEVLKVVALDIWNFIKWLLYAMLISLLKGG